MKTVYHEAMHPLGNLGLKISMAALESPHIPMHWHDAMEILFCLNGEVTIQIDHEAFLLSRNQLVVFDSKEMHSIQSASPDRKSTRLNSSHRCTSRMPSSA